MKKKLLFGVLSILAIGILNTSCEKDSAETENKTSETFELTTEQETLITGLQNKYNSGVINFTVDTDINGSPYKKGTDLVLTLSSSGALFIDSNPLAKDGDEVIINTFNKIANEYVWKDLKNDLEYALSIKLNTIDEINEVNVIKTSTKSFLASLKPEKTVNTDPETPNTAADNTIVIGSKVIDFSPGVPCLDISGFSSVVSYSLKPNAGGSFSMIFSEIMKVGNYKMVDSNPKTGEVSFFVNDGVVIRSAFSGGTLNVTTNASGKKVLTATNITLTDGVLEPGTNKAIVNLKLICN